MIRIIWLARICEKSEVKLQQFVRWSSVPNFLRASLCQLKFALMEMSWPMPTITLMAYFQIQLTILMICWEIILYIILKDGAQARASQGDATMNQYSSVTDYLCFTKSYCKNYDGWADAQYIRKYISVFSRPESVADVDFISCGRLFHGNELKKVHLKPAVLLCGTNASCRAQWRHDSRSTAGIYAKKTLGGQTIQI